MSHTIRSLSSALALSLFQQASGQHAVVRAAPPVEIPAQVDGNSPSYWLNGRYNFLTSTGSPVLLQGANQESLEAPAPIRVDPPDHLPIWFESAWVDEDGTVYAWYHHEPQGVCPGSESTAPRIGAAVSYDGGLSFYDLGIVLTSGDPLDCSAMNGFFAGGHGDFSVILDRERGYFYFLFTNYGGALSGQGVAMARLAFADRVSPAGAVWKYHQGEWAEPGLEGRVTPIFPARAAWQRSDADSFWGPAIHWNTYLEAYVVLLNHACCEPRWPQEGIYVAFNADLSKPADWTEPAPILSDIGFAPGYYPQAIGGAVGESDTLAGGVARLWVQGRSRWEIEFRRIGEEDIVPEPEVPEEPPQLPTSDGRRAPPTGAPSPVKLPTSRRPL